MALDLTELYLLDRAERVAAELVALAQPRGRLAAVGAGKVNDKVSKAAKLLAAAIAELRATLGGVHAGSN